MTVSTTSSGVAVTGRLICMSVFQGGTRKWETTKHSFLSDFTDSWGFTIPACLRAIMTQPLPLSFAWGDDRCVSWQWGGYSCSGDPWTLPPADRQAQRQASATDRLLQTSNPQPHAASTQQRLCVKDGLPSAVVRYCLSTSLVGNEQFLSYKSELN